MGGISPKVLDETDIKMADRLCFTNKVRTMNNKLQIIALNVVGIIGIFAVSKIFGVPLFIVAITAVLGVVIYRAGKNRR